MAERSDLQPIPVSAADQSVSAADHLQAGSVKVSRATTSSRIFVVAAAAGLVWLGALALGDNRAWQLKLTDICVFVALASMWNLLAGFSGLVSIGQQAFVGLGAYALIVARNGYDLGIYASVIPAGIVTLFLAVPIALVAFRLRGGYFAIGTWVIAEVVRLVVKNNTSKTTGGGTGTSLHVSGYEAASRISTTALLALIVAVAAVAVTYLVLRGPLGLSLQAIRDNEEGARGLGTNVFRSRLVVYLLAAAITGFAGAVYYVKTLNVQPDAAFSVSFWTAPIIVMVVVGGLGTIEGPIIGAVAYYLLRDYLTDEGHWPGLSPEMYLIVMGLLTMVCALYVRGGLWGTLTKRFPSLQLFPLRRRLEVIVSLEDDHDS
jgi:branched-chain amino acid transport system permease protein